MNIPDHVPIELVVDEDYLFPHIADHDPMAALHKVREQHGEIFYTRDTRRGMYPSGYWVVTSNRLIQEILRDATRFSSHRISGFGQLFDPDFFLLPLEIDPPLHTDFRRAMAGFLSPQRVSSDFEPRVRQMAVSLIEKIRPQRQCEFIKDFATPFPILIFMQLMGVDAARFEEFLEWEHMLLRGDVKGEHASARREVAIKIRDYLVELVAARRESPQDDLVSEVIQLRIGDRPITEKEILEVCYLLFVGGLDTVAATLGYMFRHLASSPADRKRLREEPSLMVPATEELLRRFSVVPTRRSATRDIDFHGVTIKKGEYVECDLSMANTCPMAFDQPLDVKLDRRKAHVAFSAGPHRCMGVHLARLELRVAMEEWLMRIPDFEVNPSAQLSSHFPGVKGLNALPLLWKAQ